MNRELSVFGVLLARENAQSRAAALTLFPPEQAVRVLGCWPEDEQADIILRLAGTGRIKAGRQPQPESCAVSMRIPGKSSLRK